MNPDEIRSFLDSFTQKKSRTVVIIDFGNVDKWADTLGWKVGLQEMARLVKYFAYGNQSLRRFYYGIDMGPKEKDSTPTLWSKGILDRAKMNNFEVVQKRVKYIHDPNDPTGYEKKCDLDVEMAVDLIKMRDDYDHIIIFSGDGDLVYALEYLHTQFGKEVCVFGARGHMGKEVIDAHKSGIIKNICYAEDFRPRLEMNRTVKKSPKRWW